MPDSQKREPEDVKKMFSEVSKNYDKINRAMCFGLDARWRRALAKTALRGMEGKGAKIADLACGSGDVCVELARLAPRAEIVGADFCPEMLELAAKKAAAAGFGGRVKFTACDCQKTPFESGAFDAATIAFGFRNFQNRAAALAEISRILRRGGRLAMLEVSRAGKIMEPAQRIFMERVMPNIAALFGGKKDSYVYLAKTTLEYPRPREIEAMFAAAGFGEISTRKFGFGLVAITTGVKK